MLQNIYDLMENIEDSSVMLEETNVVSSERIKELTKMKIHNDSNVTVKHTRRNWKKTILTVSIAAAVVTAVGAVSFAALKGGLEGVAFGNNGNGNTEATEHVEQPVDSDETGVAAKQTSEDTDVYSVDDKVQMISLQGFSDSPEYLAAQEWKDFEDGYDKDRKILDQVGNKATEWDEKYGTYGVYSQDMADKVDEIVSKYNLSLHGKIESAEQQDLDEKYDVVMKDATYVGYCFPDGTFQVDGEFGKYDFQLRRTVKGVLDTVYLNVGMINDYEQWEYKTASGKTVQLALSEDKAVILANLDDSFVTVNVLLTLSEDGPVPMSKADLENMADQINFATL